MLTPPLQAVHICTTDTNGFGAGRTTYYVPQIPMVLEQAEQHIMYHRCQWFSSKNNNILSTTDTNSFGASRTRYVPQIPMVLEQAEQDMYHRYQRF